MKRFLLFIIFTGFLYTQAFSQTLYDSFTDGDFTAAPPWGGNTSSWTVVLNSDVAAGATGSNTVRLAAPAVIQTDYLSSQLATWHTQQEWGFWIGRRAQAYTAANQAYFWLYANEADLTSATVDGYRIAIGDDSGGDNIRLEYILNGTVNSTFINSNATLNNGLTDIGILVRVTRTSSGLWTLYLSTLPTTNGSGAIATDIPNAANTPINEGSVIETSLIPAANGYIGFAALHTTSANATAAAEFDQIYFNEFFSNTITTGTVSSPPFVLTDCSDTETGTVAYTSTGTFNGGNIFTAQLSDDVGSFASPVNIGTDPNSGLDPSGTINITIPAGTVGGTGYLIRVVSSDPVTTGSSSATFTITQLGVGGCASSNTDYYRSIQTGNWGSTSTWESSPDNSNWIPATLTPTNNANTVWIRNTHTVSITSSVSVDQVEILNGGILDHTGGTITVYDGIGQDININVGGIFILSVPSTPPSYIGASPSISVNTGAILRVTVTGLTGAGAGVNANNFVYQDQSILDYTPTASFSSSSVTYFPNADAVTIPIFRVSNASSITVGAAAFTTFNGVFESNGGGVVWQGAGDKTFRNGITGSGNISSVVSFTGDFLINGSTASLGGAGTIDLSMSPGSLVQFGTSTVTTMTSGKTIIGDVSLLADSYINLQNFDLTVSGTITGGGTNAYIRTNGTGVLTVNTVGAGGKTLPIGNTSYNPLVITNGNNENYSARVETGIVPPIAFPAAGINRTWNIFASNVTPGVTITFQYAGTDANPSVLPTNNMEILLYSGSAWSIIPGNNNIPAVGSDPYTITSTTALIINNSTIPYALGKAGGYALPLDYFITARAQKNGSSGIISWNVFSTGNVLNFEVQRSVNGQAFETIAVLNPVTSQTAYSFTDALLEKGTILYRVRVNRTTEGTRYSNTVAIINDSKGLLITSISPNPVDQNAVISLSAAKQGRAGFEVYNIAGHKLKQWMSPVAEGSNTIHVSMAGLPAGVYHVMAYTGDTRTVFRFVKQ